ncbi:MAG: hypothetical protein KY393_09050 [Actinobacteria bacterium]|nr:hypothetical protein [Actinomycetota bacterium]
MTDAELTDFFSQHRSLYHAMAEKAYEYSKSAVEAANLPVRIDDVIQALLPPLEIEPTLRERLAEKRLNQKFWFKRFGNYVLDQLWEEIANDSSEGG